MTQETPREAATPRPWIAGVEADGWYSREFWRVPIGPGKIAATHTEADAALIVAAVNDYDRLLRVEAAARNLVAFADSGSVISGKRYFHASRLVALREALGETER